MQFLIRFLQELPWQPRAVWETCLYGLAAGGATVAFQLGMNRLYHLGLVQLSRRRVSLLAADQHADEQPQAEGNADRLVGMLADATVGGLGCRRGRLLQF